MSAPCHSPGCSPTHTVGERRTLPALPPRAAARLQRILDLRRLAGRSVHGLGPAGDGLYLALVRGALSGWELDEVGAWYWEGLDAAGRTELDRVFADASPSPVLGINRAHCRAVSGEREYTKCDFRDLLSCQYGRFYQTVQDLVAMRGGVLRQFANCDLVWRWLFNEGGAAPEPGTHPTPIPIPAPAELYTLLRTGGILRRFDMLVPVAATFGVRLIPTLFTLDGGSGLNERQGELSERIDPEDPSSPTFGQVVKRSQYPGVILPSEQGWGEVYWDESEVGYEIEPLTDEDGSDKVIPAETRAFARYALQLRPSGSVAPTPDDYLRESARRKCVALIAFGRAIGEHLAEWEETLGQSATALTTVVPYVELGNEMSQHWRTSGDAGRASARELGWFMALLASAASAACPSLRFAAPGLAAWGNDEPSVWEDRVSWVKQAIEDGMTDCLRFLDTVREGLLARMLDDSEWFGGEWAPWRDDHAGAAAFIDTMDAVSWDAWPAPGGPAPSPAALLHFASLHWYHPEDMRGDDPIPDDESGYAGEQRLVEDIDVFRAHLGTVSLGGMGLRLGFGMTEYGFPAAAPQDPGPDTLWCSFTSPLFQAGKVVRLSLVARALGAEVLCWNTHIAQLQDIDATNAMGWTRFSTMGLRHDYVGDDLPIAEFRAHRDATRRPSWYAFGRLAALLEQADDVSLHEWGHGLFVVRLDSETGFSFGPTPGSGLAPAGFTLGGSGRAWPTAYVAWVDQTAADASLDFELWGIAAHDRLSLAPAVEVPAEDARTAVDGYAAGDRPDWTWSDATSGWTWTSVADVRSVGRGTGFYDLRRLKVTVHRDAQRAPVPVCILCEHRDLEGIPEAPERPELVHTLWGRDLTGPIVEADLLVAILEHPTDGVSGLRLERLVKPRQFEPWGRR